jgi:hypothetical protein
MHLMARQHPLYLRQNFEPISYSYLVFQGKFTENKTITIVPLAEGCESMLHKKKLALPPKCPICSSSCIPTFSDIAIQNAHQKLHHSVPFASQVSKAQVYASLK